MLHPFPSAFKLNYKAHDNIPKTCDGGRIELTYSRGWAQVELLELKPQPLKALAMAPMV